MRLPIRLRPHHLGCVQGFTGHGYDREFTSALAAIARAVRTDPALPIVVVDGVDDVCAACPHSSAGACARDEGADGRVQAHDAAFRRALGLVGGGPVTIAAINDLLARDPAVGHAIRDACGGCPWTGDCTFFARLAA